jgi:hypothetical protein
MIVQKCSGQKKKVASKVEWALPDLTIPPRLENLQNAPEKTLENGPKTHALADEMKRWAHRAYILNSAVAAERLVVIEEAGP